MRELKTRLAVILITRYNGTMQAQRWDKGESRMTW